MVILYNVLEIVMPLSCDLHGLGEREGYIDECGLHFAVMSRSSEGQGGPIYNGIKIQADM